MVIMHNGVTLSLGHLRAMTAVTEMGGINLPGLPRWGEPAMED